MAHNLALRLVKELIRINTVNPPGNESGAMRILIPLLQEAGFTVAEYPYGSGRSSIVAHFGRTDIPSLILSGHLDTVPFGAQPWTHGPLDAEVVDGKLYGRGAADMKGGVAVLVASAIDFATKGGEQPVTLLLTADEEIGCSGVAQLLAEAELPPARGVLVAEPTGNEPCLGHKGVFWLKSYFHGKTAHAAFPELGDNALFKAAEAVLKLGSGLDRGETHPVMGDMTLVASRFFSGDNYNSVPDKAEVGLDIRSTVNISNETILDGIKKIFAPYKAEIEVLFDLPPIWTDPQSPFVRDVAGCCSTVTGKDYPPRIATFYTEGGLLGPGLGDAPVIILGPGESGMAHKVDEFVEIDDLIRSIDIYLQILSKLCR